MKKLVFSLFGFTTILFLLVGCSGEIVESADPVTAFDHVNLVPMTEEIVLENQTVLVNNNHIMKIGPSSEVEVPENAHMIDGRGLYLMPGLADMHIHAEEEWPVPQLNLYLANGVTTIRSFSARSNGDQRPFILDWRDEVNQGIRVGPTIYTSGAIIDYPEEDITKMIDSQVRQGVDFIKLYSGLTPEEFRRGMEAAKKLDMYVAGHIPYTVSLEDVLSAGFDEIAHVEELIFEMIYESASSGDREANDPKFDLVGAAVEQFGDAVGMDSDALRETYGARIGEIIGLMDDAGITVGSTLVVDEVILQKLFDPQAFQERDAYQFLPDSYKTRFQQGREKHQMQFMGIEALATKKYELDTIVLQGLKDAGVAILLGTDAGTGDMGIVPGFSLHDELRILVENGFTPFEAITTGIVNAAACIESMGGDGNFGTIEPGARADLILIEGNPLEDVAHIQEIRGVMANGRWYDAAALQRLVQGED